MDSRIKFFDDLITSSIKQARLLKDDVVDVLNSSSLVQTATSKKDALLAKWRWHDSAVASSIRVPIATEWDFRHYIAIADLAQSILAYSRETGDYELPPTTLAIVLAQLLVFHTPDGVPLKQVCLSPFCIVDRGEWHRLFTAAFVHMDSTHLVSNLASVVPDCLYLERTRGSMALAADATTLTLLSHGLYVGYAMLEKALLNDKHNYYSVGAVGFSGVVFALKVVAGKSRVGQQASVLPGILVPAQYAWVYSLGLTTLLVPQASFPGHLCGVLAGVLKAYLLEPVAKQLQLAFGGGDSMPAGPRPRFYGSGTLSGRPVGRPAGLGIRWLELLKQLGLAAAAVGVYAVAQRRIGASSNMTRWRY